MISVIIPAFNEEKNITSALESLTKQTPRATFEVIVVDNNSSDGTLDSAKKYEKKINLNVYLEKRRGRGAAKARGAREAKGDILAYLDADTRAYPDWIAKMTSAFEDEKVVAVTGPWRVYDLPDGFTKWFLHSFQEIVMIPIKLYLGTSYMSGMNMAVRRDIYQKSGGFNVALNVHDDFDLAKRVRKFGEIKYVSDMLVETSGRRYKNGIITGLLSYHRWTLNYLLNRQADLEDIR